MNPRADESVTAPPRRPTATAVCDTLHLTALAIWLGALMTGAISASIVFPTLRRLNPRLPDFESFTGEHWKIAAGQVQQPVFTWADIIQLAMAGVVFFTLGLRLVGFGVAQAPRRSATVVRTLAVSAAVVMFAYNLLVLAPRMYPHLKQYWALAREGQTQQAQAEADLFGEDHPTATRILSGTAACVLTAFVAGAWTLARKREP